MKNVIYDRTLRINETVDTVDNFIECLCYASFIVLKAFKDGEHYDCISIKTTKELNEQLADTPKNKKTWDKIYDAIPSCILSFTTRIFPIEDSPKVEDYLINVYCDLTSKDGKELAKNLIKECGI